jgi:carbonic anhydrase/acetyltransferase-like protein (isoleucine patch superfamily)
VTDSHIRNSIIGENARVLHAMLENSIVGNGSIVVGGYEHVNVGDSSEIGLH